MYFQKRVHFKNETFFLKSKCVKKHVGGFGATNKITQEVIISQLLYSNFKSTFNNF